TFITPETEAGRVSGVFKLMGQNNEKRGAASAGETVAFGKLEHAKTGETLTAGKQAHKPVVLVPPYPPVLAIAIAGKGRKDDVKPLPRGSGFKFEEMITGGAVPRNYIPSVEEGVIDGLKHGPLGFAVIDLQVTLTDGSYHAVDSSDMAFRQAGRIGIHDALPEAQPVLLEPIHLVEIVCPTDATAKINAILSGRRGQILGFDTRDGWAGWDSVK